MPGTLLIHIGLCVLALMSPYPSFAAPSDGVQFLQWESNAMPGPVERERDATPQTDVWQRIRNGFKIDDAALQNPLVATHTDWYANRPDYMRRMVERSRRYLYHIVQELDRRAMPMEIALLPMIESAFNPTALSRSAASGIWQFIPSTGRLYGLKQNDWYDGRRDFTAATHAALDYLGKLYLDFGDWQLALAAYNCGEGCVARAIQKNVALGLPTDYASLSLPTETRHYVPKLLAVRQMILASGQYGITLDPLPNQPYFDQVTVHASMDVQSAARLAGVSHDEFLALNAAFPRKLIRSDTPVNLLVPAGQGDAFERNLQAGDWDSWQPYTAQRGERPAAIAQRLGVSLARLEAHNQFHLKRGKFSQTQTILVPVKGRSATASIHAPLTATAYTVQRGDSLFAIARKHGLSVAQLSAANPQLSGPLQAGHILNLPAGSESEAQADATPLSPVVFHPRAEIKPAVRHHQVRHGDTLHGIAQRFDVSLADLKSWNPRLRNTSLLHPGQRITIKRR